MPPAIVALRSFKNKFEHRLLDRHVGAEMIEYLLTGNLPDFDPERLQNSTTLLYNDLLRQGLAGVTFRKDVAFPLAACEPANVPILAVTSSGEQFAIALSGPLTTDHPAEPGAFRACPAVRPPDTGFGERTPRSREPSGRHPRYQATSSRLSSGWSFERLVCAPEMVVFY